jgi:hypothetical protein
MLYVRKDLASKHIDWRGVGRGAKRRPSKCLELHKSLASFGISAADSRFAHARSTPQLRLSKSAENNFGAASRFVSLRQSGEQCRIGVVEPSMIHVTDVCDEKGAVCVLT